MSIKQAKDGRWYAACRYKDYAGRVHQKKKTGFARKYQAQDWLNKFLREVAEDKDCTGMNLHDLMEAYIDDMRARGLKESTVRVRRRIFEDAIKSLGGKPVVKYTTQDLQQYLRGLCKRYKRNTVNSYRQTLNTVFAFAVRHYGLARNPCTNVVMPKDNAAEDKPFWTLEQFTQFDDAMREYAKNNNLARIYETFFYTAYWTGARRGEILALRLKDLDFKGNVIHIRNSRNEKREVTSPKNRMSVRDITMPECLSLRLREYIGSLYDPKPSDMIFEAVGAGTTNMFQIYRRKFVPDLPNIHLHSLRHSHAALLMELGIDPCKCQ